MNVYDEAVALTIKKFAHDLLFPIWAAHTMKVGATTDFDLWCKMIVGQAVRDTDQMIKAGRIKNPERGRWQVRLMIIAATNYMVTQWQGVCRTCGTKTMVGNSMPDRLQCNRCAAKQLPVPAWADLVDLLQANFPHARIQLARLNTLTDEEKRELDLWLGKVSAGGEEIPALPAVVLQLGNRTTFGAAADGRDYFPVVEIGTGGTIPPSTHSADPTHEAFDKATQAVDDAQADLERLVTSGAFPEEITVGQARVASLQQAAIAAKDAMTGGDKIP